MHFDENLSRQQSNTTQCSFFNHANYTLRLNSYSNAAKFLFRVDTLGHVPAALKGIKIRIHAATNFLRLSVKRKCY